MRIEKEKIRTSGRWFFISVIAKKKGVWYTEKKKILGEAMDIHYNAFISYRHHPEDIKVAEQIHRSLEHYRVPKAIRAKKDTKMRLFRDKEELPITSNLTDDITRALRNSDFLIVICSTHTRESLWVQREIETFLQTHDHSRVLTVLVNGEPYDTIPEILCSREQVDPVTGEKQLLPIEPLSCDWRVSRTKAMREELPRLAAALLGCGYDELRQRERQYRTRRLVTIFSVALAALLALMGYVIHNSMQIQKANDQLEAANDQLTDANIEIQRNLEESLINQSQYLASASAQQLEEGDRMLAMALAMAGLPRQDEDRPYVAQTEHALGEAVGVYMASSQIAAVGSINCDALISYFDATDDRSRMFVFDQRHVLSVWDMQTYQQITAVQTDTFISKLLVTPEDTVLIYDSNYTVHCFDKDLNLLWQQSGINEVAMSQQRDVLLAEMDNDTVAFFDVHTGEEILTPVQFALPEENGWIVFRQERYDLDLPLVVDYEGWDDTYVVSADLNTGIITKLCTVPEDYDVRKTAYDQNGNIVVLTVHEDGTWNASFNQMLSHRQASVQLLCLSPAGEQLWTTQLNSYSYSTAHTLYPIPGTNNIFCQVDSILAVLDSTTGQIINTSQTGGNPVWVQAYEDNVIAILDDGSVGSFGYDDGDFGSYRYFKEDIGDAFGGKGYFVKQNTSAQILVYQSVRDENWTAFDGDYDALTVHRAARGDYVATYNYDSVSIFDARQQKLLYDIKEDDGATYRLLEFTEDGTQLWLSNQGASLVRVDMQTGKIKTFDLPQKVGDESLYYSYTYRMCMTDDVIYTMAKALLSDEIYVIAYDVSAKKCAIAKVEGAVWESALSADCEILTAKDGRAYVWHSGDGKVYETDTQTGQTQVYLDNLTTQPVIQFLNDGSTRMTAADDLVTFFRADGSVLFTAQLEFAKGVSAWHTGQEILLLTDTGDIFRYSLSGEKLGETSTHLYSSFFSNLGYNFEPEEISWTVTDSGDLFVNIFQAGNLISTTCWERRAFVPNCVAYISGLDQFVTTGKDKESTEDRIGIYPCYTLEDVRNLAVEAMKGFTLTQDQKDYYGIS